MGSVEDGAELPPVCILAGGLGTRLAGRMRQTSKPLLEVAGEPFLVHQLRLLAAHGAREVVLCVGYLGEQIETRIGAERFGMQLRYSFDAPGLEGTLGAIRARGRFWARGSSCSTGTRTCVSTTPPPHARGSRAGCRR